MASVVASSSTPSSSKKDKKLASILSLPGEVLELIGFYCAISTPGSSPDVASSSSIASSSANPDEIDYSDPSPPAYATPPVNLRNFVVTCRQVHDAINVRANSRLYARVFKTKFDVDAIKRRFGSRAVNSNSLARELQWRCMCLKRIRRAVALQNIRGGEAKQDAASGLDIKRMKEAVTLQNLHSEKAKDETLSASSANESKHQAEVLENFWLAYMMITENDGLNVQQLRWAQMGAYISLFRSQDILTAALREGYPSDTAARSLALHVDYLLSSPQQLSRETREQSAEKLFILRPYVFAAHRYDAFYLPWTYRCVPRIPSNGIETMRDDPETSSPAATANPFVADLKPKENSMRLRYCGKEFAVRAPNITHAACSSFFMKVERDPIVSGPINTETSSSDEEEDHRSSHSSTSSTDLGHGGRTICVRNPALFRSKDHDRDVARLLACASPSSSPGLKITDHLRQMEGSWEGRFTFFDFDSYRDMLGGKVRALYEGPFGEQPQVWKIHEHVIKVRTGEYVGGKGSSLNAGFTEEDVEPDKMKSLSADEFEKVLANMPTVLGKRNVVERHGNEHISRMQKDLSGQRSPISTTTTEESALADDDELSGAESNATTISSMCTNRSNGSECDQYEILLSGEGHSAWGRFLLRGRIRTWDGLVTLTKEYRPDGRGRWLYRGYVVAGGKLVGRWRDTFTPELMSGYEGCFVLQRRGN